MHNFMLESHSTDPYYNLALEQCLFDSIKSGDAAMYLWQNQNTVVIGRNQNAWRECRCELLASEGGRLARRSSGGGAVFHDLGNLNFTFAAAADRYALARQLGVIQAALAMAGIHAQLSGRNDITVEGRKVSGNAFQHGQGRSLQHGTLLVAVDMEKLSRYLNPSPLKLNAKGISSVRSRVVNLKELSAGLDTDAMRALLKAAFRREYGDYDVISAAEFDPQKLTDCKRKMASWEWRFGCTPRFDVQFATRFEWGELEISMALNSGWVEVCTVHTDAMDEKLALCVQRALTGAVFGAGLADELSKLGAMGIPADMIGDMRTWLAPQLRAAL